MFFFDIIARIGEEEFVVILPTPEKTRNGKVRIAFGSCFHRWGLGNKEQADLIQSRGPIGLLLIGDIAVKDRNNHFGLHRADYLLRDFFTAWRNLVATVPVYPPTHRLGVPRL